MLGILRTHLATLKGRLVLGAAALLSLFGVATWIGFATVETLKESVAERFDALREGTKIGTQLEELLLQQITAGQAYLASGDPAAADRFADVGRRAHALSRQYRDLPDLTTAEQTQVAALEKAHSRMEVHYALAHALRDLGRPADARVLADSAAGEIQQLQATIRRIGVEQADKMAAAGEELQRTGRSRQDLLLAVLTLALGLGAWIMYAAIRGIDLPLRKLVGAAEQLGEGDLRVELNGRMLREFDTLAVSFNTMAARLRTLVLETVSIAEQISSSSFDLSSISEEVAASSEEVATAMVEITRGAETQSNGLQTTRVAVDEMTRRTQSIAAASRQVAVLSTQIYDAASASRTQVEHALQMLLEIRGVVRTSEEEVRELEKASSRIGRFVETISGIARQTNLLALNAAIEAARAGEHGRGFAVVAEEVRKLADGSARASQEVAQVVNEIRGQVERMVVTMERGSQSVAGAEEVSKTASAALEHIRDAVDDIRSAAERVTEAVDSNQEVLVGVEQQLLEASGTAESHAASAQQVSAAAEEQSAATEEMSTASQQLLRAADRMKELVSGMRI